MLRLARHEQNARTRRQLLLVLLLVVPVVSTIHAVCFFLDGILFPGLRRVEVRRPVFIVGHARSGTTLLHRLLCMDPGRYSFFRLYEMFLPSLIEKKAIRAVGWLDERVLGGRLGRRVQALEARTRLAAAKDMHRTGLTEPEEDDFVLTFSMASGFWIVMAPYMGDLDFYYVDERSPRARRRLMSFYKECVRRQLYANGGDRIHLSKNPTFCGRVESLLETFPDARFVVLLRDPSDTIPSLLKLLQQTWRYAGWDEASIQRSLRVLADQSFHAYHHPLDVLARHPEVPQAVVDYRDLVAAPKATVVDVYRRLGLDVSAEFDRILDEQERRARAHETTYRYSLEEFGLARDEIRTRLADLFARYGWDADEARAAR
jgi:omega-hydroxy-beta-dihydromenaquinone-9 sulfotransferase